jgi:hypothetical protein
VIRRVAVALAVASVLGAAQATDGVARAGQPDDRVRVRVVSDLCRVRADAPVACSEVASASILRGETTSFQVLFESTRPLGRLDVAVEGNDGLRVEARRAIFLPVRSRTRGPSPDGDSLAWSATARPPDDEVVGLVADPLVADLSPEQMAPAPGARTAIWVDVRAEEGAPAGPSVVHVRAGGALRSVAIDVVDASLPAIPVSFFAYLEDAELGVLPDADQAREVARRLLLDHHVAPIGLWLDVAHVERDRRSQGDVAVLGAYGLLGEPTAQSMARVERMVGALRDAPGDVVVYAADEQCDSPLPGAWRAAIRASARPEMARLRVLATCDRPGLDADVAMVPAGSFTNELAARHAADGTETWVYNGRLPHAGPMALDAPPESLNCAGWIAARYDVKRWFYWNTNHWTDRNRGGRGPRDLYADTESFHNADGDVVLGDGILLYPTRQAERFTRIASPDPVLGSIRLARIRRGAEDAALLALGFDADPELARSLLRRIVPRALGEVPSTARSPFAGGEEIRAARSALHVAIARARGEGRLVARLDEIDARASLRRLRESTPAVAPPTAAGIIPIGLAVFAVGALVALVIEWWRRPRRGGSVASR